MERVQASETEKFSLLVEEMDQRAELLSVFQAFLASHFLQLIESGEKSVLLLHELPDETFKLQPFQGNVRVEGARPQRDPLEL